MNWLSVSLNIFTILLVSSLVAIIIVTHSRRIIVTNDTETTASQAYKDMAETRNYESIRMTEPLTKLLVDQGPIGSFEPIDNYTTYMITF